MKNLIALVIVVFISLISLPCLAGDNDDPFGIYQPMPDMHQPDLSNHNDSDDLILDMYLLHEMEKDDAAQSNQSEKQSSNPERFDPIKYYNDLEWPK